jgi:CheY-like chemotaxis protein
MMKKRTILLVDDVALFIQLQKSFLSRDLFEINTARSGEQALKSVRFSLPDLVLLDLYMPDMNGDTVCRELKNDPLTRDIPIIIVSSEGDEDAERMCRLSGCDDFIHKPIRSIRTLSQSGAFIEIGFAPALEETLKINFSIPSSPKALKLKAAVRWTGRLAGDQALGAGVKFKGIDVQEAVRIKEYVESELEEQIT